MMTPQSIWSPPGTAMEEEGCGPVAVPTPPLIPSLGTSVGAFADWQNRKYWKTKISDWIHISSCLVDFVNHLLLYRPLKALLVKLHQSSPKPPAPCMSTNQTVSHLKSISKFLLTIMIMMMFIIIIMFEICLRHRFVNASFQPWSRVFQQTDNSKNLKLKTCFALFYTLSNLPWFK